MSIRSVKLLLAIHIGISIGGMIIHMNLHPATESLYFFWASPVNVFSVIVIPVLLARPSTVGWGFMLNAGTILIGTVGMSYFTLLTLESPVTAQWLFTESPLKGIVVLWAKLPIAWMVLVRVRPQISRPVRGCPE